MSDKVTMEDVVRNWDKKIAKTIVDAGIPYDDVDDVKSEIYLSMVRRDICNKYDSARAKCFSTYLYTIVHSLISNRFRDYHRKKQIPRESLVHVWDWAFAADDLFAKAMHTYNIMDEIERTNFVENILVELSMPENQKVIRGSNGASLTLKEAVTQMLAGQPMKDVAASIGARTESIKKALTGLKNVKWIIEYNQLLEA